MAWTINGSPVSINGTEVVINEGAADLNFRVESDDGTNVLFCDAGLGSGAGGLGFFGATPVVQQAHAASIAAAVAGLTAWAAGANTSLDGAEVQAALSMLAAAIEQNNVTLEIFGLRATS
jgi:hypothetical protein